MPTPLDVARRAQAPLPHKPKRKRKRKPAAQECSREGCTQPRAEGKDHCTSVCWVMSAELGKAERLCRRVGTSQQATELWLTATELGDLLSRYLAQADEVRRLEVPGPRGGTPTPPRMTGT